MAKTKDTPKKHDTDDVIVLDDNNKEYDLGKEDPDGIDDDEMDFEDMDADDGGD